MIMFKLQVRPIDKIFTGGRFIHWSISIQHPISSTHARDQTENMWKIVRHCDSVSLLMNTFGIHLEPGCKSCEQIIHYRTAKNVQKQATVLLYF